jgi:hypothetical protein
VEDDALSSVEGTCGAEGVTGTSDIGDDLRVDASGTGAEGSSCVGTTSTTEGVTGTSAIGDGLRVEGSVTGMEEPSCAGSTSAAEGVTGTSGTGDGFGKGAATESEGLSSVGGGCDADESTGLFCAGSVSSEPDTTSVVFVSVGIGIGISCVGINC